MKCYKKLFSIILAILFIMYTPCISFASNEANSNRNKYEEYHDQINFNDLMVFVVNKDNIVVNVDPAISFFKKIKANLQKKKYDRYIDNHPEGVDELIDYVNSSDCICAISYTEAPVVYVEDHFERIPKENINNTNPFVINANAAEQSGTSIGSKAYNFTLKTTILKRGVKKPYTYYAMTSGTWSKNSSRDSKKKPAAGFDYVLQSCPVMTTKDYLNSTYTHNTDGSKNGQMGINYFRRDGGSSWVKYEIADNPSGLAQLSTFKLTQTFSAQATSETKKIYSYYVHTWKAMSVSATATGNVGTSGGSPSMGVSLTIIPSIESKQWQIYDYVVYSW